MTLDPPGPERSVGTPVGGGDVPHVARPARPSLDSSEPPPVTGVKARPVSVRRLQSALQLAISLAGFSALTMFLTRGRLGDYLVELLSGRESGLDPETIEESVGGLVAAAIVLLLLVVLLEALLLRGIGRRWGWSRWALPPVALFNVAVALTCVLLVPRTAWQGWVLTASLLAGVLAALFCAGAVLAPSIGRWFTGREGRLLRTDDAGTPAGPPVTG